MWYTKLPHINVFLNAATVVLLVWGYAAIRRKNERLHAHLMVRAFACSTLFLASYLTYHYLAGHRPYPGQGWGRTLYLVILLSHIGLAIATVPLVLTTLFFALRKRFDRHRRLARWTLPIWLYVSVTGVVVYVMLYVLHPA